tara:strand:+ start:49 stop:273 length:225 start_codon:yes stop_codon:yes gene_type:complete
MDSENRNEYEEEERKKEDTQVSKIEIQDGNDAVDDFAYYREIASELRSRKEQIVLGEVLVNTDSSHGKLLTSAI